MNLYLMVKVIAMGVNLAIMGITFAILALFALPKTLIFNSYPVTMPVRCIVIFLCIVVLINGAQVFM